MIVQYNHIVDSKQYRKEINANRITFGRENSCDIVLASPGVAQNAAVLEKKTNGWELKVLGFNGILVDQTKLFNGEKILLDHNVVIRIFPYDINIELPTDEKINRKIKLATLDKRLGEFVNNIHIELVKRTKGMPDTDQQYNEDSIRFVENHIEGIAKEFKILEPEEYELVLYFSGIGVRTELLTSLSADSMRSFSSFSEGTRGWSKLLTIHPTREKEMHQIAEHIKAMLELEKIDDLDDQLDHVENNFWDHWDYLTGKNKIRDDLHHYLALRYLKKTLKDIFWGYGPLEDLLRLHSITEIMVVNSERIFVEKKGRIENSGRRFLSDDTTVTIMNRIVSRVNRHIDKSSPLVDARLLDGSRVNAVIDPIAISGPCLTIRKFPEQRILIDDLIRMGSVPQSAAEFLRASVLNRRNIIVSGGTGTGKTTLLNCLSDFIPDNERIVTIEDTAELRLNKEHVVRMETKEANIEGKGAYTIRDLVKNALRMRPDRVVIGECRGPEALDMLQAMNTGHDGSLTTIHANSAEDVILRLEVLVQMAANLPTPSIYRQIVSAVDLIVQIKRMRNGRRCLSQISEVTEIDPMTGKVIIKDIFRLENDTEDNAVLKPTGSLPSFMDILIERKLIQLELFYL
jgi:Flp pilus assembly CpaF family ATPase/pSer/pThr/pTyr-binding forkhead associated (FHA) protein